MFWSTSWISVLYNVLIYMQILITHFLCNDICAPKELRPLLVLEFERNWTNLYMLGIIRGKLAMRSMKCRMLLICYSCMRIRVERSIDRLYERDWFCLSKGTLECVMKYTCKINYRALNLIIPLFKSSSSILFSTDSAKLTWTTQSR